MKSHRPGGGYGFGVRLFSPDFTASIPGNAVAVKGMVIPPRQILPSLARAGHGISEFAGGFTGTCTQTALEVCVAAVQNRAPDPARMVAYTRDMIRRGWCAANGASTLAAVAHYARSVLGLSVATEWEYQEPLQQDWLSLLRAHAGIQPILMQVAHGANLLDAETGARPEAAARGLRYHAIAVVGKQQDGYICCDGDHPQVDQRFQIYTRATLTAAVPCGLLMLAMPAPHVPPPSPPADPSARYRAALAQIRSMANAALS
jgi:hypothetical protein